MPDGKKETLFAEAKGLNSKDYTEDRENSSIISTFLNPLPISAWLKHTATVAITGEYICCCVVYI